MTDTLKSSIQKDSEGFHILVETEDINFSEFKKAKILYYIVHYNIIDCSILPC